jgi:hypothetical protein
MPQPPALEPLGYGSVRTHHSVSQCSVKSRCHSVAFIIVFRPPAAAAAAVANILVVVVVVVMVLLLLC